jgi:hypothetical protein
VFDNVTVAFGAANTPPTGSITSPTDGAVLQDPTTVSIQAIASDADGFVSQVAFYDGANLLGTLTASPYTWPWTAPASGAHTLTVRVTDNGGLTTTSAPVGVTVSYTPSTLPAPWQQQDIGAVGVPGSGTFANGAFSVAGSGTDVYGYTDQFHFAYQTLAGDGEIVARVASVQNTNAYAKAGVMIRQDLTPSAAYAMMEILPRGTSGFQWRPTLGANTASVGSSGAAPYWVRLVRAGTTLTAYRANDGVNWTPVGTQTVNLSGTVYVGLAVTAHNNAAACTAVFDNVTKIGN